MNVEKKDYLQKNESADDNRFKFVVVSGVASGAGKTSVAEALIKWFAGKRSVSAVKITVTHGERGCPHGGKGCNTCSSLGGEFQIIKKKNIIEQSGTDTERFVLAGGKPVLWAITKDRAIENAWGEIRNEMNGSNLAVIESNTLACVTKPGLTVMVVDPTVSRKLWKDSSFKLIKESDFLIFNNRGDEMRRRACLEEVERIREKGCEILFTAHPHLITRDKRLTDRLHFFI